MDLSVCVNILVPPCASHGWGASGFVVSLSSGWMSVLFSLNTEHARWLPMGGGDEEQDACAVMRSSFFLFWFIVVARVE